jgi:hypothetical protein
MLRALRSWLARKKLPNSPGRSGVRSARPELETLETREVLSTTVSPTYQLTSGLLYLVSGSSKTLIDSGARSFSVAPTGRLYVLQTSGVLLGSSGGVPGHFQQVATSVKQFAFASTGRVYVLQTTGVFLASSDGLPGDFTVIDRTTRAIAVDSTDKVFDLENNGSLLSSTTGLPGSFTKTRQLVTAISVSAAGSVVVADWFGQHMTDSAVATLARQEFNADNSLSRSDMLALFTQAESGGTITGAEIQSLRAIASNPTTLHTPAYVEKLTYKTVYSDPADAVYQGRALAALVGGSQSVILQDRVNKWFFGLDHPNAAAAYEAVPGTLFGPSGPLYTDVSQGLLGDCWLLGSLAETAARTPSVIKSMFIDNGDGTWSVRIYHNGLPDWVTVDNELPGGGAFYDASRNGVLWVALAEKAFAQENGSGWLGTSAPGRNAYNSLNSGDPAFALSAITGRVAQDDYMIAGLAATAWQRGGLVVLASVNTPPNPSIVGYHAYAVVNYDVATDTYTLFNPWGVDGGYSGKFYPGYVTIKGSSLAANFDLISSAG